MSTTQSARGYGRAQVCSPLMTKSTVSMREGRLGASLALSAKMLFIFSMTFRGFMVWLLVCVHKFGKKTSNEKINKAQIYYLCKNRNHFYNQRTKNMSQFTEPVENLFQDSKVYLDKHLDNVKLRTVKGLSLTVSAIGKMLVIFAVASICLLALSFSFVMWLGELLGSYALGGFIVAGVLLLATVVLVLLRDKLFKNSFISLFEGIIIPEREDENQESLDQAIVEAGKEIEMQEAALRSNLAQAQNYYAPSRLLNEGLRVAGETAGRVGFGIGSMIPLVWRRLFGRKRLK